MSSGTPPSTGGPPITAADLRELERDIRSMVEHDNELLNHRIQWFLTLNGFLFTAVAIFGNQPGRDRFGTAIATVGLLTCVTFWVALKIGRGAFGRLVDLWGGYRARCTEPFNEVSVYGYLAHPVTAYLGPWLMLPYILGLGILWFVHTYPGTVPPGTYSTPVIEAGKQEVKPYDTRTGEAKP